MSWFQKSLVLPSKSRGSYLITDTIVRELPELKEYKVGLLNLFIQHTSCALSLNENWDEDVREDMSDALDRIAPEDRKGNLYRHSAEGLDDMPVSALLFLFGGVWRETELEKKYGFYGQLGANWILGSHQECIDWRECYDSY